MTQTLQSWSTVTYFANVATIFGVANQIKSIVANADGGYTIFADQGRSSFVTHSVAITFDAFGNQAAPQTNADFFTGFIESGGDIDEVFRSGSNLVYTFETYAALGLSPLGPTITGVAASFTAAPLVGSVASSRLSQR